MAFTTIYFTLSSYHTVEGEGCRFLTQCITTIDLNLKTRLYTSTVWSLALDSLDLDKYKWLFAIPSDGKSYIVSLITTTPYFMPDVFLSHVQVGVLAAVIIW